MMQNKAISARINKKQGTVDFIDAEGEGDDGSTLVSPADFKMIRKIEAQNERIVNLLSRAQDTNEKIRQSDEFTTQKAKKEVRGAAGADEDMADDGM